MTKDGSWHHTLRGVPHDHVYKEIMTHKAMKQVVGFPSCDLLYLAGLVVFNKGKVGNRNARKHKGGSQMIRNIYRNWGGIFLRMGSPSAQPRACEQDENSAAKCILHQSRKSCRLCKSTRVQPPNCKLLCLHSPSMLYSSQLISWINPTRHRRLAWAEGIKVKWLRLATWLFSVTTSVEPITGHKQHSSPP